MTFTTYGVVDPRTGRVFYVGQTHSLRDRIASHHRCDPGCGSYAIVCRIRDAGLWLQFCSFGEFDSRFMARRLERILILSLDGLVNDRKYGLLSESNWPISWVDRVMLNRAIDPFPAIHEYPELVAVNGPVRPMIHRPGAYELEPRV